MNRRGFTLVEMMVVTSVIATLSAIAIPAIGASLRVANERNAAASIKTLGLAETDFRSNDRDQNGVMDFWTGDVAALLTLSPGIEQDPLAQPIALIDRGIAGADANPYTQRAAGPGWKSITAMTSQVTKAGYWYYALRRDRSNGRERYQNVTAARVRGKPRPPRAHHLSKFGFVAFPDGYGGTGKRVFMINESCTVISTDPGRAVKRRQRTPPGAPISRYRDWPSEATFTSSWSTVD